VVVVAGNIVVVTTSVVVTGATVVVVTGPSVVVVVEDVVVLVEEVVVAVPSVVVVVAVVVVAETHGQLSVTGWLTVNIKQVSESVAVVGSVPLGAHTQLSAQVSKFTEARRMYRQSVATGAGPLVMGWLQSPRSAPALGTQASAHIAAKKNGTKVRFENVVF